MVVCRLINSDCVDLSDLNNFLLLLIKWLVDRSWYGSPSIQTTEKAAAQKSRNYKQNTSDDVTDNRSCSALWLGAAEAIDRAAKGTSTTVAVVNLAITVVVGWVVWVVGVTLGVVWIVVVTWTNNNNRGNIGIVVWVRWCCVVHWLCVRVGIRISVSLRRRVSLISLRGCLQIYSVITMREDGGYTKGDKTWEY